MDCMDQGNAVLTSKWACGHSLRPADDLDVTNHTRFHLNERCFRDVPQQPVLPAAQTYFKPWHPTLWTIRCYNHRITLIINCWISSGTMSTWKNPLTTNFFPFFFWSISFVQAVARAYRGLSAALFSISCISAINLLCGLLTHLAHRLLLRFSSDF